jgi:hypothetical protein
MSRDVYRDPMNKLPRSNSHDNIPLNPMSTVIHSKPTSRGAGENSLGAKDNGSPMSSSTEHVASSPFHNVSSAIAVSFCPENF